MLHGNLQKNGEQFCVLNQLVADATTFVLSLGVQDMTNS